MELEHFNNIPENDVEICILMKQLKSRCQIDMQYALRNFTQRGKYPVTNTDIENAVIIQRMANILCAERNAKRASYQMCIDLKTEKYDGEPFSICLNIFLTECYLRALAYYMENSEEVKLTQNNFAILRSYPMLKGMISAPISLYPVEATRLALMRVCARMGDIPLDNDEMKRYLIALRVRAACLQVLGEEGTSIMDYPAWCKKVSPQHNIYRASFQMLQMYEVMFYHFDLAILHIEDFRKFAQPQEATLSMCSEQEILYTKDWLSKRRDSDHLLLETWRREVVDTWTHASISPFDRAGIQMGLFGEIKDHTVFLKAASMERSEAIMNIYRYTAEEMVASTPVVAEICQFMSLLQQLSVPGFDRTKYIYWLHEVPNQTVGYSYPPKSLFTVLTYPIIYIPLSLRQFWVIFGPFLYDCGDSHYMALTLWTKLALGKVYPENCPQDLKKKCDLAFAAFRQHSANGVPIETSNSASNHRPSPMEEDLPPDASAAERLLHALVLGQNFYEIDVSIVPSRQAEKADSDLPPVFDV